jgi:hypothetical protein
VEFIPCVLKWGFKAVDAGNAVADGKGIRNGTGSTEGN